MLGTLISGSEAPGGGLQMKSVLDQLGASNPLSITITKAQPGDILIMVTTGFEQTANGNGVQVNSVKLDGVEQHPKSVFPVNSAVDAAVLVTPRSTDVCLFMMHGVILAVGAGVHTVQLTAAAAFNVGITNFGWCVTLLYL